MDELPESALEFLALGPLVVDGDPVGHQGRHGGGPLVREHHGVAPFEDRGHEGGGRDDGRDGHVPVEEPELGRAAHEGVEVAADASDRQSGLGRGVLNGGEPFSGRLDDAQRGVRMVAGERLHRHDGVDAPAERDQGPTGGGIVGDGRRGPVGALQAHAAQVEAVAVGEFTQAVDVVAAEEVSLERRRREVAQIDKRCGRSLVVRHAGQQVQDAHSGVDSGVLPVARRARR